MRPPWPELLTFRPITWTRIRSRTDSITAISLVGIDPAAAQSLRVYLVQPGGRFLQPADTDSAIISQAWQMPMA